MNELTAKFLGKTVQDVTTGYTGICITIVQKVSGNYQIGIQPKCADGGTFPECMWIDTQIIDIVDDGLVDRVTPITKLCDINIGDEVEDVISGYTGIVFEKSIHFNGCEMICVARRMKKKDTTITYEWFSSKRIKVTTKQKVVLDIAEKRAPGGPSVRMSRTVGPRC